MRPDNTFVSLSRETQPMSKPSFHSVRFNNNMGGNNDGDLISGDTPSLGTITTQDGDNMAIGYVVLVVKKKKHLWYGKVTRNMGGGIFEFKVYRMYVIDDFRSGSDGDKADFTDAVTVTVINPATPPQSSPPTNADPQPVVVVPIG
jgi:hypothetical protein